MVYSGTPALLALHLEADTRCCTLLCLRVPNIMKRECAVTILAQNAKQGTPLSHSKQVACDKVLGQNSCQPEGLQPESALAALLDLPIE